MVKILNDTTYELERPTVADVEIGDAKQQEFYPQIKIMKWDNEANLSVRYDKDITDATHVVEDGIVKWTASDGEKVYIYDVPTLSGCEHGGYELEVILPSKPASNVVRYTITTKELRYEYQPELTPDEKAATTPDGEPKYYRPENVVGSYAVYHKTKKNNQYKAGKAFHIYRPQAEDAKGNKIWCELNVDVEKELLTITVPQEFLDKAVYPVKIDPTFGQTDSGDSSNAVANDDALGWQATCPAVCTATSLTAWLSKNSGTGYIKAVIWNSDGTRTIISDGVGDPSVDVYATSQTERTSSFSSPPLLAESTDYHIGGACYTSAYNINWWYDNSSGQLATEDTTNSYASPQELGSADSSTTQEYSIYITYELAGTTYSGSCYDSFTVSGTADSTLTPSGVYNKSLDDSFSLGDSTSGYITMSGVASDGLALNDTTQGEYVIGYLLGDIGLHWEEFTGNLYETTTTGTVSFGDTTSATVAFAASTSDSLGINDTPTVVGTYITSTSDSSTFNDTTTVSGLYSTSASEGFSINDSTSGVLLITCSGVDSFIFNDTTSGTSFILKTVIDSFTMNDVGAGVANFTASLIENSGFGDSTNAVLTAITATSDSVDLSDTPAAEVVFDVSLTDTLVFSDSTAQELLIALTLADGLTIQDNTSGVSQIPVSTSEVVLVSDTNSPSVLINFTVADSVELQDAVNAIASFATTIGDGFTLSLTVDGIQVGIKIVLKALNKTYTFIGKVNTYTIAAKRRSPSSGK